MTDKLCSHDFQSGGGGRKFEVSSPTQNSNELTNYIKIQIKFLTFRSSEIPTSLWIYRQTLFCKQVGGGSPPPPPRPLWLCHWQRLETGMWDLTNKWFITIISFNNLKSIGFFPQTLGKHWVYSVSYTPRCSEKTWSKN